MLYWLKLIRASTNRLSVLSEQGKRAKRRLLRHRPEAVVVGTCYGLRRDDCICPLHRDLGRSS